jgi:hypothetical protein
MYVFSENATAVGLTPSGGVNAQFHYERKHKTKIERVLLLQSPKIEIAPMNQAMIPAGTPPPVYKTDLISRVTPRRSFQISS